MNIYLVVEDGERYCVKAENMKGAIDICHASYLDEMKEDHGKSYNEAA